MVGAVLLAAGVVACGDDDAPPVAVSGTAPIVEAADESTTTTAAPDTDPVEAPSGDAFYVPPDPLPAGEAGDVIWSTPIEASAGRQGWKILYLSESVQGDPIAVSGLVSRRPAADRGRAPADPRDRPRHHRARRPVRAVVPAGHRYRGRGQSKPARCQPTSRPATSLATDYEGLGTPGDHTYLVGLSEGRHSSTSPRGQRLPGSGLAE